jgi:hypothetical protein
LLDEQIKQGLYFVFNGQHFCPEIKLDIYSHLVVAATATVNFFAGFSNTVGQ